MIEYKITSHVQSHQSYSAIEDDLNTLREFLYQVIDGIRIIKKVVIEHNEFDTIVWFYVDTPQLTGASIHLGKIQNYLHHIATKHEFELDRLNTTLRHTVKEAIENSSEIG